jgi:hypothetical protein
MVAITCRMRDVSCPLLPRFAGCAMLRVLWCRASLDASARRKQILTHTNPRIARTYALGWTASNNSASARVLRTAKASHWSSARVFRGRELPPSVQMHPECRAVGYRQRVQRKLVTENSSLLHSPLIPPRYSCAAQGNRPPSETEDAVRFTGVYAAGRQHAYASFQIVYRPYRPSGNCSVDDDPYVSYRRRMKNSSRRKPNQPCLQGQDILDRRVRNVGNLQSTLRS